MKYERRSTAKKFRLQSGRSTASRSNPTPSNHSVRLAVAALFLLFSVFSTIFVSRASPSPTILRLQRFVVSPAEMKKNSIDTKIHKANILKSLRAKYAACILVMEINEKKEELLKKAGKIYVAK
ncbi:PREDICTED: uncharacterized protein LOC109192354 isoform X1 [Ipomoea nil]|uniref:uncharacterized protein LOC109192354 isoform X1 n=1 Tax=Ipomoea nil TaxID=35883 RepID=UPI0009012E06|nr:PREDICTED: uncharacterized protein LOC109192354 isoform X1 [Ipomoea nil]